MSQSPGQNELIERDLRWMEVALSLARGAEAVGEVPIAAIVVFEDKVVSSGINLRENHFDSTAHAEITAVRAAGRQLRNWRLLNCTLYVTLEPCLMCAGAIYLSRIPRVVYAATDSKAGAYESLYEISNDFRLNHRPEVNGGLMAAPSRQMLKEFFMGRRRRSHELGTTAY